MQNNTRSAFALIFIVIFGLFAPGAAMSSYAQVIQTPVTVAANDYPVRIFAPSIKLNSPIQSVGVTPAGAMAVPSGRSNNVGWYKYGVVPGTSGTAVLDAHVFAAFKTLAYTKVGSDIYVLMASGKVLHFVVTKAETYSLSKLSGSTLFAATYSKQINLITCAGQLTSDRSTYTQRLIVSAKLV